MRIFQLIAAALTLVACQATAEETGREASPTRVIVELTDGSRLEGPAAVVRVYPSQENEAQMVELTVTAGHQLTESWALVGRPSAAFLTAGSITLPLTDRPLNEGVAAAQRGMPDGTIDFAVDGFMNVSVSQGRVTGTVTTTDDRIAAEFEGDVVVICLSTTADQSAGGVISSQNGAATIVGTPTVALDLTGCTQAN